MKLSMPLTAVIISTLSNALLGMFPLDTTLIIPDYAPLYKYNKDGMPMVNVTFVDDVSTYRKTAATWPLSIEQIHTLFQNGEITFADVHLKLPDNDDIRNQLYTLYDNAEILFKIQPVFDPKDKKTLLKANILEQTPKGAIIHGVRSPINESYTKMKKQHGSAYQMLKSREIGRK